MDGAEVNGIVICLVSAHDAQGATTVATSPVIKILPGVSHVQIKRITGGHDSVTVSGVAGPKAALKASGHAKPSVILARFQGGRRVLFVQTNVSAGHDGRFTLTTPDAPGRHTYQVTFYPADGSFYETSSTSRTFTLHR